MYNHFLAMFRFISLPITYGFITGNASMHVEDFGTGWEWHRHHLFISFIWSFILILIQNWFERKMETVAQSSVHNTVFRVIFACLGFREFVILELFTKSRIRELSISMIGSDHDNTFHEILKFANLSSARNLRKLKPCEYYQIYSIFLWRRHVGNT